MMLMPSRYDREGAVHEFCTKLWQVRDGGVDAKLMARGLALATAQDVMRRPEYDPSSDCRQAWAREVIEAIKQRRRRPRASGDLEALTAWLLEITFERCGKDYAAQV